MSGHGIVSPLQEKSKQHFQATRSREELEERRRESVQAHHAACQDPLRPTERPSIMDVSGLFLLSLLMFLANLRGRDVYQRVLMSRVETSS